MEAKKIDFAQHKNVTVQQLLARGGSCATYICQYENKTCILKEFLPISYFKRTDSGGYIAGEFEYNTETFDQDPWYVHVLPAQSDELKASFSEFLDTKKKISDLLNETLEKDQKLGRYITAKPLETLMVSPLEGNTNRFAYLELYDYDEKDFNKNAPLWDLEKRLVALIHLCKVVDKFHQAGLCINDLKPQNFLYDVDAGMPILKIFDLDSVKPINKSNGALAELTSVPGVTPFFSADEYFCAPLSLNVGTGIAADIYSLGAILMYLLFMHDEAFVCGVNQMQKSEAEVSLRLFETCAQNAVAAGSYTEAFLNYAKHIITHSVTQNIVMEVKKRYHKDDNGTAVQNLENELNNLLEILRNNGVHPVLMQKRAQASKREFLAADFDPDLFAELQEIKED